MTEIFPFSWEGTRQRGGLDKGFYGTHFQLKYHIESVIPTTNIGQFDWYLWEIVQSFDFTSRSILIMNLETSRIFWNEDEDDLVGSTEKYKGQRIWARYFWFHFLSLCLSAVSFVQNWKYYYDIFKSYNRIKLMYFYKEDRLEKMRKYRSQRNKISKRNEEFILRKSKHQHSLNFSSSVINSERSSFNAASPPRPLRGKSLSPIHRC